LEEWVGGQAQAQYVWGPGYVDQLVERDRDANGDGTLEERLYALQDANWNVTALMDTSGNVVERYAYDPFGQTTALAPAWSTRGSSAYGWAYPFQTGRYDSATGLYGFRERDYSPTLGRFVERDPLGFAAGDTNVYRFVGNGPTNATDPSGLDMVYTPRG